jgi:hypothetical protein
MYGSERRNIEKITQHFFYSYKFIKQEIHFIIDFHPQIEPCTFLGSLAVIVKLHVKAWLLISFKKEILETHISL